MGKKDTVQAKRDAGSYILHSTFYILILRSNLFDISQVRPRWINYFTNFFIYLQENAVLLFADELHEIPGTSVWHSTLVHELQSVLIFIFFSPLICVQGKLQGHFINFLRPQMTFDQCDYLIAFSCGYHFSCILII